MFLGVKKAALDLPAVAWSSLSTSPFVSSMLPSTKGVDFLNVSQPTVTALFAGVAMLMALDFFLLSPVPRKVLDRLVTLSCIPLVVVQQEGQGISKEGPLHAVVPFCCSGHDIPVDGGQCKEGSPIPVTAPQQATVWSVQDLFCLKIPCLSRRMGPTAASNSLRQDSIKNIAGY